MSAREDILAKLRVSSRPVPPPPPFVFAEIADLAARFIEKAKVSIADVKEIASESDCAAAVRQILKSGNEALSLHIPAASPLLRFSWSAEGIDISHAPPSGTQTAFSRADFAVAETGTLVFLAGPQSPSSWHFRPGREIVLVRRSLLLPRLENLFVRLREHTIPATVNLVTGPSRTADIEQTIELGAHGPCAIHLLLAP